MKKLLISIVSAVIVGVVALAALVSHKRNHDTKVEVCISRCQCHACTEELPTHAGRCPRGVPGMREGVLMLRQFLILKGLPVT